MGLSCVKGQCPKEENIEGPKKKRTNFRLCKMMRTTGQKQKAMDQERAPKRDVPSEDDTKRSEGGQGPPEEEPPRGGEEPVPPGEDPERDGGGQGPPGEDTERGGHEQGPPVEDTERNGGGQGPPGEDPERGGEKQGPPGEDTERNGGGQGPPGEDPERGGEERGPPGGDTERDGGGQGSAGEDPERGGQEEGPPKEDTERKISKMRKVIHHVEVFYEHKGVARSCKFSVYRGRKRCFVRFDAPNAIIYKRGAEFAAQSFERSIVRNFVSLDETLHKGACY